MSEPYLNKLKVEKLRNTNEYTALSIGDYNTSLGGLLSNGFQPVNVEKLAEHRVDFGIFHEISWTGTRVSNLFVSFNGKFYLAHSTPDSLLMDPDALQFVQNYHSNFNEISFNPEYVDGVIEIPVNGLNIPVKTFLDNPVSKFLFGNQTEVYKAWLEEAGIPSFPIMPPNYSLTSRYEENFVRPLIVRCTDNWSGIITANADLHVDYGYRGFTKRYNGDLAPVENFARDKLGLVHKLIQLEDRSYSLIELERLFRASPYKNLLNPVLRIVRNGGSSLPANLNTFNA